MLIIIDMKILIIILFILGASFNFMSNKISDFLSKDETQFEKNTVIFKFTGLLLVVIAFILIVSLDI